MTKITKIVSVVLGILMIAAVCVGAGAASDNEFHIGDVYNYKLYTTLGGVVDLTSSENQSGWSSGSNTVSFIADVDPANGYYLSNVTEGVYYKSISTKTYYINVRNPTTNVNGVIYNSTSPDRIAIASLIGNDIETDKVVNFTVASTIAGDGKVAGIKFTNPDHTLTSTLDQFGAVKIADEYTYSIANLDLGVWTVQAYFNKGVDNGFATLAPTEMLGKPYQFTVVEKVSSKTLTSNVKSVVQNGFATVTLTANYGDYKIGIEHGTLPTGQTGLNVSGSTAILSLDTSGVGSFVVQANETGTDAIKINLYKEDGTIEKTLSIKVESAKITATPEKTSVYIGDEFEVTGTSDIGGVHYFYVTSTNYGFNLLNDVTASGKEFKTTIRTADIVDAAGKNPDAGVYTFYVVAGDNTFTRLADLEDSDVLYTTFNVALKQPFISVGITNPTVVQNEKLELTGTAEGVHEVMYYIFGTNSFNCGNISVDDDGYFELSRKIVSPDSSSTTDLKLANSQYYVVVASPMYDQVFNVGPIDDGVGGYNIVLNESGSYTTGGTIIFNTAVRQSSNAAVALVEAIGNENIDDMCAKLTFVVAPATSVVNSIPATITQGEVLTISGQTTGYVGKTVNVEISSTAFTASSKEESASSILATKVITIPESGAWSTSFNTATITPDNYYIKITVASLDPVTEQILITAPVTEPTVTPTTNPIVNPTVKPTTTTASTPGFGVLSALVGLGAVAVLMIRRD